MTDIVRITLLTIDFFCLLQLMHFIIVYWKVIYPLRVSFGSSVLAPPPRLTLWYHILVALIISCNMVGVIWNLTSDRPLNPVLFPLIAITAALTWVVRMFTKTYLDILKGAKDAAGD